MNKLEDDAEVLFRHIHPSYMHKGEPSSDRFRPSSMDDDMLSVDRSALTTAADAHALFTKSGRAAIAVFGLSVAEFGCEQIVCLANPIDTTDSQNTNLAHALADYSSHPMKSQRNVAKKLQRLAVKRGQLHPATLTVVPQDV